MDQIVFTQDGNLADARAYDQDGNITSVFWFDDTTRQVRHVQTDVGDEVIRYDSQGNAAEFATMSVDPLTGLRRTFGFTYDVNGNVTSLDIGNLGTERRPIVSSYGFDNPLTAGVANTLEGGTHPGHRARRSVRQWPLRCYRWNWL